MIRIQKAMTKKSKQIAPIFSVLEQRNKVRGDKCKADKRIVFIIFYSACN